MLEAAAEQLVSIKVLPVTRLLVLCFLSQSFLIPRPPGIPLVQTCSSTKCPVCFKSYFRSDTLTQQYDEEIARVPMVITRNTLSAIDTAPFRHLNLF